jgi:hypothetical protein
MGNIRRLVTVITILVVIAITVNFTGQRYLRSVRQQREAHFIAIHFLVMDHMREHYDGFPKTWSEIIPSSATEGGLMSPFPNGLIYKSDGTTFSLAEPKPRFVSFFRKDRLVADDKTAPHWESSGIRASKFRED